MHLYVLRHGIAISRKDPKCPPDPKRSLTSEGIEKTSSAAAGLRRLGIKPERIITSPYRRAVQTAEIAARELGVEQDRIQRDRSLQPGSSVDAFREVLTTIREKSVLCVGHAPHLDELIACFLGCSASVTRLKKAGAAGLEIHGFRPPESIILWMFTPKVLRRLGGLE